MPKLPLRYSPLVCYGEAVAMPGSEASLMEIRSQFPRTAAAFAPLADGGSLSAVLELEQRFVMGRRPPVLPPATEALFSRSGALSFDVVLAGGGLSLIYAAMLAGAGLRVCVFDRRQIGCGHREWNISRRELEPLAESGLYSAAEVSALVRMQYRSGFCSFASGAGAATGRYCVEGVLDCVVDAEALLSGLRARAAAAGVTLLDHHQLDGYRVDREAAVIAVSPVAASGTAGSSGIPRLLRARLLIDGLGAASPHARFDLCCPTVGGVMEGLVLGSGPLDMDPTVGEILVTTEGVEEGQQHIWEGFPAPLPTTGSTSGRMTIYLFYYQRAEAVAAAVAAGAHPLLALYERFFATLPRYKRTAGGAPLRLLRPTYGYIPAYTRLGPMPTAPSARVLLVGDAAARHSPLTFCGFGSMIRSFLPVSRGIVRCLKEDRLGRRDLDALWQGLDPPALQVMGGLTLMMMPPPGGVLEDPDCINDLLNAAFASLKSLGQEAYAAFLHDAVDGATFIRFMRDAASRYPAVYGKVFSHLTPREALVWVARLARFRAAHGLPVVPPHKRAVPKRASGDNTGP